jgi:hypothetical protein
VVVSDSLSLTPSYWDWGRWHVESTSQRVGHLGGFLLLARWLDEVTPSLEQNIWLVRSVRVVWEEDSEEILAGQLGNRRQMQEEPL